MAPPPPLQPAAPALKQPVATLFGQVVDGVYKRQSRFELTGDTMYGWRIKLPCTGPTLFRETLQLPGLGMWSAEVTTAKHVKISDDQKRAVTEDYSGCYDGWIQHAWSVTSDDPPGEYVMTVEVDGFQPQTFRGRFTRTDDEEAAPLRRLRR